MTRDPIKFCKDCRWYVRDNRNPAEYSKCINPVVAGRNRVTGEPNTVFCDIERGAVFRTDGCGVGARHFEPLHPEPPPKVPAQALSPKPVPWWAWVLRGL